MQESFQAKNTAVQFSVLVETGCQLGKNLRDLKVAKRKLFGDFQNLCDGNKDKAKRRLLMYCKYKGKEKEEGNLDSSVGEYHDSQESILEELYNLEVDIKSTKDDIALVQNGKKQSGKALCNDVGSSK